MTDVVLHTGAEHPDLLWVLVPSFLSFLAGLGAATYADRVRAWLRPETGATAE
ncbi:hypothetical protein [Natrinema salifodinae]|uniref:Uncharacterized protein n=1 Tax=Natrinema salifodinae TaxID=1202768 RepID=A0A1I0QM74_9EURY|nr:hypothetical protein [Natrinema salifodinae]SEW28103.1 hypothetical protein SAMN05216285_3739 [Natrinema salifodinae]